MDQEYEPPSLANLQINYTNSTLDNTRPEKTLGYEPLSPVPANAETAELSERNLVNSPFLKLPREIRYIIYDLTSGRKGVILIRYTASRRLDVIAHRRRKTLLQCLRWDMNIDQEDPTGLRTAEPYYTFCDGGCDPFFWPDIRPPYMYSPISANLLPVCRQTYFEAMRWFAVQYTWAFPATRIFKEFFRRHPYLQSSIKQILWADEIGELPLLNTFPAMNYLFISFDSAIYFTRPLPSYEEALDDETDECRRIKNHYLPLSSKGCALRRGTSIGNCQVFEVFWSW